MQTLKTLSVFGFVGVNGTYSTRNAGSILSWEISIERETHKALLIKDLDSKRTTWIPKSTIKDSGELTEFGTKIVREAKFRANEAIDII